MTAFKQAMDNMLANNFEENILRISSDLVAHRAEKPSYGDFQRVKFTHDIYKDSEYIIHYGHRSIKRKIFPNGEETLIEIDIRFIFNNHNEPILDYDDIQDELMKTLAHHHEVSTLLTK